MLKYGTTYISLGISNIMFKVGSSTEEDTISPSPPASLSREIASAGNNLGATSTLVFTKQPVGSITSQTSLLSQALQVQAQAQRQFEEHQHALRSKYRRTVNHPPSPKQQNISKPGSGS